MNKQIVATTAAPKAVGPYSQAVWAGDLLFCAGQIPLAPATGQIVPGGVVEQTVRVLENLRAVLTSQGLSLAHVVKTTVFIYRRLPGAVHRPSRASAQGRAGRD